LKSSVTASDLFLFDRLKKGDESVFDFIFKYYYPGLVVYADRFVLDQMSAEDIVQDVFVKFWEKSKTLDASTNLKGYFFLSVKNGCLDYLKHQKVSDKYRLQVLSEGDIPNASDTDYFIESELKSKIDQAISNLPDRCREIFLLNRMDNMTPKEIALKLGISHRTVETQIGKALRLLRADLKDYLPLSVFAFFFVSQ
jgi:RNA polymerase sigma-70 factor (ECF subfamily)